MRPAALLLLLVVDQIDNGIAAVELPDRQIVYLPVAALPDGVREGDRVQLELHEVHENPGPRARSKRRDPHGDHHHP